MCDDAWGRSNYPLVLLTSEEDIHILIGSVLWVVTRSKTVIPQIFFVSHEVDYWYKSIWGWLRSMNLGDDFRWAKYPCLPGLVVKGNMCIKYPQSLWNICFRRGIYVCHAHKGGKMTCLGTLKCSYHFHMGYRSLDEFFELLIDHDHWI